MCLIYLEKDLAESLSQSDFNAGFASFKLGTKEVGLGFFICEMKANLQLQFYDLLFCWTFQFYCLIWL